MAWVTPPVFTVGQVLTAAAMNQISGDLTYLGEPIWDSDDAGVAFPTASVTTSTLAQTFRHLVIEVAALGSVGGDLALRFNGDTGSDYSVWTNYINGGTGAVGNYANVGATSAKVTGSGLFIPATEYLMPLRLIVPSYAGTVTGKMGIALFSSAGYTGQASVKWTPAVAAAISTITFLHSTGNFVAGTRFTIYGEV